MSCEVACIRPPLCVDWRHDQAMPLVSKHVDGQSTTSQQSHGELTVRKVMIVHPRYFTQLLGLHAQV
jgi:hypothetical protein